MSRTQYFFDTCPAAGDDWLEAQFFGRFESKTNGVLKEEGDELRLLNRVVRRTDQGECKIGRAEMSLDEVGQD